MWLFTNWPSTVTKYYYYYYKSRRSSTKIKVLERRRHFASFLSFSNVFLQSSNVVARYNSNRVRLDDDNDTSSPNVGFVRSQNKCIKNHVTFSLRIFIKKEWSEQYEEELSPWIQAGNNTSLHHITLSFVLTTIRLPPPFHLIVLRAYAPLHLASLNDDDNVLTHTHT